MAVQIPQVEPGDLITASTFNDLIEQLVSLDARVTALEGAPSTPTGTVVISSLDRTTVHEGEDITITGHNFGFTLGAHRVRFNGIAPPVFGPGSSDSVLVCRVPSLPGLPAGGLPVNLTVTNVTLSGAGASDSRTITVLPAQVGQAGNIDLVFEGAATDPVTAGIDNDFEFKLSSDATLATTVTITAQVTVGGSPAPAGWATTIRDEHGDELPGGRQPLASGEKNKKVFVRLTIPANTNGEDFDLVVRGTAPGLDAASPGALSLTVGENADPDSTFALSAATTIGAPTGQFVTTVVEGDFTVTGTYDVALAAVGGTAKWRTVLLNPPDSDPQIDLTQADLDAGGQKTLEFRVRPDAGASNPGQARLTVQRQGADKQRSITFDLNVT
jgi:hypothetical protein